MACLTDFHLTHLLRLLKIGKISIVVLNFAKLCARKLHALCMFAFLWVPSGLINTFLVGVMDSFRWHKRLSVGGMRACQVHIIPFAKKIGIHPRLEKMYAPANNMQSCLAKFYNNKSESYMQAEEVREASKLCVYSFLNSLISHTTTTTCSE